MNATKARAQLVLCIPGRREDRGALLEQIIPGTTGDYLCAGGLLMHVPTKQVFELDYSPAMPVPRPAAPHGKTVIVPIPAHQEITP